MTMNPDDPDVRESAYLSWLTTLSPKERAAVDSQAQGLASQLLALILFERESRPDLSFGLWLHAVSCLYVELEARLGDE